MNKRDLGLCFAGGGNRAFWQLGLLEDWVPTLFPRVAAMSACSAGSAAAVLLASESVATAREAFAHHRRGIRSNFDPMRALRGERPLPHEGVYRATLHAALDDAALARLRSRPFPIWILAAEPPARLPLPASLLLGLAAYQLEKLARPGTLHPTLAPQLGFRAHLHDARDCASVEALVDLVLASSSTPPFTREGRFGGARLLDGSLVDNAPAFALDRAPEVRKSIVLLTRPYPREATGVKGRRLYLAPTRMVPAHRWDYREDAPVDATLALGREDALHHRPHLDAFLAS